MQKFPGWRRTKEKQGRRIEERLKKKAEGKIGNALPVEIYFPFPALSHLFLVFHSNNAGA